MYCYILWSKRNVDNKRKCKVVYRKVAKSKAWVYYRPPKSLLCIGMESHYLSFKALWLNFATYINVIKIIKSLMSLADSFSLFIYGFRSHWCNIWTDLVCTTASSPCGDPDSLFLPCLQKGALEMCPFSPHLWQTASLYLQVERLWLDRSLPLQRPQSAPGMFWATAFWYFGNCLSAL